MGIFELELRRFSFCDYKMIKRKMTLMPGGRARRHPKPSDGGENEALITEVIAWLRAQTELSVRGLMEGLHLGYTRACSVINELDSSGFLMGAGAENERQGSFCGRRFSLVVCVWELRQPVRWTHRFAPDSASLHCAAPVQGAGKFWLGAGVLGKVRA